MKRLAFLLLIGLWCVPLSAESTVHMANGVKIGEVTSDQAIIWCRLTKKATRTRSGIQFLETKPQKSNLKWDGSEQIPEGKRLADIEGSVPGAAGKMRLTYWEKGLAEKTTTQWFTVKPENDFIHQFKLASLKSNQVYEFVVEGQCLQEKSNIRFEGTFKTAPASDDIKPITFTVTTCGDYNRRDDLENGHRIYKIISEKIKPDFFIHTGDIEYYDKFNPYAASVALARYKMNRLYAMPYAVALHKNTPSYFMKDDHDTTLNDSWKGMNYGSLTWEQGLTLFKEQFPMGELPYRTIRWGKDLQIWLMEGRDYRSSNKIKDGPAKTIWGETQKAWLKDTMRASTATFRLLISPTPIVGPDRGKKNDNHANKGFKHEGDEVRSFLASQKNTFVVNGDRHWQYHTVDPVTGLREFSCGPHSDQHAGGYKEAFKLDMHKYLRVKGGFLNVYVKRQDGKPVITFRFFDVKGESPYEKTFTE